MAHGEWNSHVTDDAIVPWTMICLELNISKPTGDDI